MSGFTKEAKKTYQFDGDEVEVVYSNLTRGDMMKLSPLLPKLKKDKNGDPAKDKDGNVIVDDEFGAEESLKMMEVGGDVMLLRIKSMSGLIDSDGKKIPIKTMLSEMYFKDLASEILKDMMGSIQVKEEDAKN